MLHLYAPGGVVVIGGLVDAERGPAGGVEVGGPLRVPLDGLGAAARPGTVRIAGFSGNSRSKMVR